MNSTDHPLPTRIAITGGAGNLGRKLTSAFLADAACAEVIILDPAADTVAAAPRVRPVVADLRVREPTWLDAIAGADAVVHLAAEKPYPGATWAEAARSFDMTANVLEAAAAAGVRRLVFASSNHVMGGYKDTAIADTPGALTTDLDPLTGTRTRTTDSTEYATAKLMGERLLAAKARRDGMTGVSLRIGWCQPGENDPRTINLSGLPGIDQAIASEEDRRELRWFQRMWLSNGDFVRAVTAALRADASHWPAPAIIVNAVSANDRTPWDLTGAARLIGYEPGDGFRP